MAQQALAEGNFGALGDGYISMYFFRNEPHKHGAVPGITPSPKRIARRFRLWIRPPSELQTKCCPGGPNRNRRKPAFLLSSTSNPHEEEFQMTSHTISQHAVASTDGTMIGFRKAGDGAPIVIVHGSISTGDQWLPVAEQLAKSNTVYVMDRRGRGLSSDADDYSLATEVEDIKTIMAVAGDNPALLGHSYGAICALEAARTGAPVSDLVLYEPPLPVDSPTAGPALDDYAAAIEEGDGEKAIHIAAAHFLRISPEETEALAATPLWPDMVRLSPTWTRELREIDLTAALIPQYLKIPTRTLLLVGEASPSHMIGASRHLKNLPNSTEITFPGQTHFAHITDPAGVAEVIRLFLQK
ncbi:alpha/beta fold hydrolase [Paenarthrobacter sp. JL.01a]|uniref:alpha/beta fold hydrolase n=1 Tax=Paenarthrobacter sp. JL.01a TaxID=2979324 RepID=UPI0021C9A3D2|nr:alpha/beta hydrolase [Paenarthrobacter sp. JL.01a]UXM92502.1 alpha/beta hydrolase [Paenarthrobacter sp. JL.01a]